MEAQSIIGEVVDESNARVRRSRSSPNGVKRQDPELNRVTFVRVRPVLSLIIPTVCGLITASPSFAQDHGYRILDTLSNEFYNSIWYVNATDTFAIATFAAVEVEAVTRNRAKKRQYDRFEQKVIKVYPYARAAGEIMKMYESLCSAEPDERRRKKLLDQAEDELKAQFENDLRKMTVSEGVILIKLIDRETGNTSYSLVQQLRGKFSAFMWQSVARLFGHNLKDEYDGEGSDVWIENIVLRIEDGSIPVQVKGVKPVLTKSVAIN